MLYDTYIVAILFSNNTPKVTILHPQTYSQETGELVICFLFFFFRDSFKWRFSKLAEVITVVLCKSILINTTYVWSAWCTGQCAHIWKPQLSCDRNCKHMSYAMCNPTKPRLSVFSHQPKARVACVSAASYFTVVSETVDSVCRDGAAH